MDCLSTLLRCVAFFTYKGNIRNIFMEFTLYQSDPLASIVKDFVLKTHSQVILEFLLSFRVTLVLGLLALDL